MSRAEQELGRRLRVIIEDRLLAESIGVPTPEDFIFIDPTFEPARVRRSGRNLFLFHFEGSTWTVAAELKDFERQAFWETCRILTPREVHHFNLLGGVPLSGRPQESLNEPTNTYGPRTGEGPSSS